MRKVALIGMALILVLLLLVSCGGVPQKDYDKVSADLAAAQIQLQSLQNDLGKAQAQVEALKSEKAAAIKKATDAMTYIEFLDILMYPAFKKAGITLRLTFASDADWFVAMKNKASSLNDAKVNSYIQELEKGNSAIMNNLMDYFMETIQKTLK